jgi:transcription antitermination factor NusG
LTLEKGFVVKFFEPGDDVRVIDGQYKGETGLVTKIDGKNVYISLD